MKDFQDFSLYIVIIIWLIRDVEKILNDWIGSFKGIKSQSEEDYVKKVKSVDKLFRRICILEHSIPNTKEFA